MDQGKKFITKEGLKQLDNYKYHSSQSTWLDSKMNPFWQYCASLLPKNLAPNLITFIGWILVILSYVIMLFYDYTFKKTIPSYCFFLAALFIFIYMTLDAIDGKQARNIKASSPLGQLFDHGCDSFSMTFFVLAICQATKLESNEVFMVFVAAQLGFFTANWTEYHTGVLRTKVGQFGVTQMQFTCIFIHLLTGIFGQKMWQIQVQTIVPKFVVSKFHEIDWLWQTDVKNIIVYVFAISALVNLLYIYISTLLRQTHRFQVAAQFLPLFMIIGMQLMWFQFLPMYQTYGGIILVNFGVLLSFITCKLIICSVTKMKFQYLHKQFILFIVITILMFFVDYMSDGNKIKDRQVRTLNVWLFWLCFIGNLYSILKFLVRTIQQITQYLGIYCFSVEKRKRKTQ